MTAVFYTEHAPAPRLSSSADRNTPMIQLVSRARSIYADHGEKLRFLIVGGWNTVFSYILFAVLLQWLGPSLAGLSGSSSAVLSVVGSHWYLAVQWLSWLIAVPQSTLTLKYLVFHSKGHAGAEIGRAFFVYLPMQGLSSVSLWLLVTFAGVHPLVGQLLTIGVTAVLSYIGHKYFTFRSPRTVVPADEE